MGARGQIAWKYKEAKRDSEGLEADEIKLLEIYNQLIMNLAAIHGNFKTK